MVEIKQPARRRRVGRRQVAWMAGAAVLAILIIFLGVNFYFARHRLVFVLCGYDQPLTVSVPGAESVSFSQPGRRALYLPEGSHVATVTGVTNQTIPFAIGSDFFGRFFDRTAFVLNPGGASLVVTEETVYAGKDSGADPEGMGGFQLHYGQPFFVVPGVDYLFEEFPEHITITHSSARESRRRLDQILDDPLLIFYSLVSQAKYMDALRLAEWHVTLHPERTEILSAYVGVAQMAGREEQARVFLAQNLGRRPMEIEWHRMYQETRSSAPAELVTQYDALLAASPADAAAYYLRGRLAGKCSEAIPYYVQAVGLDATNGFALFALGLCQSAQGQWAAARQYLGQAVQAQPDMLRFKAALFDARIALQEFEAMETELRSAVTVNPVDYLANVHLMDVLLARGQPETVDLLLKNYEMNSRGITSRNVVELIPSLKAHAYYSAGRFEDVLSLAAQNPGQLNASVRFEALIELARFDQAFKLYTAEDPRLADPIQLLTVSLALKQAGQQAVAETWRTNALQRLARGRAEFRLAHAMLTGSTAPSLGETRDLSLTPSSKAVLLVALAQAFPERRTEFLQEARSLNVSREYPFHLLRRIASG